MILREESVLVTAIDIPLHGEEFLVANLDKKHISGSLAKLVEGDTPGGIFDVLLRFLVYRNGLEEHRATDCRPTGGGIFRCDSMTIERRAKEVLVSFEGGGTVVFSAPDGFYRRIKWTGTQGESLELFPSGCRR